MSTGLFMPENFLASYNFSCLVLNSTFINHPVLLPKPHFTCFDYRFRLSCLPCHQVLFHELDLCYLLAFSYCLKQLVDYSFDQFLFFHLPHHLEACPEVKSGHLTNVT